MGSAQVCCRTQVMCSARIFSDVTLSWWTKPFLMIVRDDTLGHRKGQNREIFPLTRLISILHVSTYYTSCQMNNTPINSQNGTILQVHSEYHFLSIFISKSFVDTYLSVEGGFLASAEGSLCLLSCTFLVSNTAQLSMDIFEVHHRFNTKQKPWK